MFFTPSSSADPCAGNPCENGATCESSGISYQCICNSGYSGANCNVEGKVKGWNKHSFGYRQAKGLLGDPPLKKGIHPSQNNPPDTKANSNLGEQKITSFSIRFIAIQNSNALMGRQIGKFARFAAAVNVFMHDSRTHRLYLCVVQQRPLFCIRNKPYSHIIWK